MQIRLILYFRILSRFFTFLYISIKCGVQSSMFFFHFINNENTPYIYRNSSFVSDYVNDNYADPAKRMLRNFFKFTEILNYSRIWHWNCKEFWFVAFFWLLICSDRISITFLFASIQSSNMSIKIYTKQHHGLK